MVKNEGKSVIIMQTPSSRAINVGYIKGTKFIPCRENLGVIRQKHTFQATVDSLKLPEARKILKKYKTSKISTVSILREALACQLGLALAEVGIIDHYGDSFVAATHIKKNGNIITKYKYENIEGLCPNGLWVIADSICMARNLGATVKTLLSRHKPKEILFIAPIASSIGINTITNIVQKHKIPITFIVWGALFGVNKENLYDMPWGDEDTKPLDKRDQQTFIDMYGSNLCVGGDFGNDYYCPEIAKKLYHEQLKDLKIKPNFPSKKQILDIYKENELIHG